LNLAGASTGIAREREGLNMEEEISSLFKNYSTKNWIVLGVVVFLILVGTVIAGIMLVMLFVGVHA